MATALRLTPQTMGTLNDVYDTPIDFDEDEVLNVVMRPLQSCQVLTNQKYPAFVYDNEKTLLPAAAKRMVISVDIYECNKTTKSCLDTLFTYDRLINVYYKYKLDNTAYKVCILDPNTEEIYYGGKQAAKIVTKLTFYESSYVI